MKIVLASSPAAGHLNPLLVVARMLQNAGHETAIYTGSLFREKAQAVGAKFYPLPADVDFDLRDIGAAFPEWRKYTPGPQQMLYGMKIYLLTPYRPNSMDSMLSYRSSRPT